jgi:hypothetical protein
VSLLAVARRTHDKGNPQYKRLYMDDIRTISRARRVA